MRLGTAYVGKLHPLAQEQLDAAIAGFRENKDIISGVMVLPAPDGCAAAHRLQNVVFQLDLPPKLPFDGCDRNPCCGCAFEPVISNE